MGKKVQRTHTFFLRPSNPVTHETCTHIRSLVQRLRHRGGGNATRVSTRKRTRACYHLRVARFGAGSKERARRDEAHRVDEEAQGPSTRQFESHTDAQIMTIKCGAASDAQRVK